MDRDTHQPERPDALPQRDEFIADLNRRGVDLAVELGAPESTIDIVFLAYLQSQSRFGFFSFGPITIDVHFVERIVEQSARYAPRPRHEVSYSDDYIRFTRVLMDEVRRSGRRRVDELHFLLAFMRVGEGLPGRVFAELGVTPEQVEAYVATAARTPATPVEERLYSPEEVADYLSVHVKTVRAWIRSGKLPASRLAGQRALRIRASDLARVLEPVEVDDQED